MAARVYRSVKVAVQNNGNDSMIVQGLGLLRGEWTAKLDPKQGDAIEAQSAREWGSESTTLGSSTHAFVRLGSIHGYSTITWDLPWVGELSFNVETPAGLRATVLRDEQLPDAVAVRVVLVPHEEIGASRREG